MSEMIDGIPYEHMVEKNETLGVDSTVSAPLLWQSTYDRLVAARNSYNSTTKVKQNRQFYSNEGADYLLESVAKVLSMISKPDGMKPKDWAVVNPDEVLIVDARRIVFHIYETLANAPQAAVRGRLIAMWKYAPEIQFVGLFRQKINKTSFQDGDAKFQVVLYRSDTPTIKSRKTSTEDEDET